MFKKTPPSSPSIPFNRSNSSTIYVPSTFNDSLPLPKLIVFDLDYTLWPFWVDTHVSGPLKSKDNNTRMVDRWGESFTFYPGVPHILHAARERGITMGLASRTHAPDLARDMLKGLVVLPPHKGALLSRMDSGTSVATEEESNNVGSSASLNTLATKKDKKKEKLREEKPIRALEYFTHMQIFPGNKTGHFQKIQEATKKAGNEVAFADMLFFDDEARNRNVEVELGVCFWLVRDGVSKDEIDKGIWEWRKRRGISKPEAQP